MTVSKKDYHQGKSKTSHKSKDKGNENFDFFNYDRRALEKELWILSKLMNGRKFKTVEEANDFYSEARSSGMIENFHPDKAEDRAQLLAYEAFSKKGEERRIMTIRALEISENCPDAYIILAEMEKDNSRKIELYGKGVDTAERILGKEIFHREKGNFWRIIETRQYMRAQEGLAFALWNSGKLDDAQRIYERLLDLNPNDNQGNRYSLLLLYMYRNDYERAKKLLGQYDEDSAEWDYNGALLLYLTTGITMESKSALRKAFESNKYVPVLFLRDVNLPPDSNYITPGEPDEAGSYIKASGSLWLKNFGAMKWLFDEFTEYLKGGEKTSRQFFGR
jgi:tetratricopeptide (TPR) repeat protein